MPQASQSSFAPRSALEVVNLGFDFAPALAPGETLITDPSSGTPSCTVNVFSGQDPSAQSRLLAGPTISGTQVGIRLGNMIAGVTYQPVVVVQTSNGETLDLWAYLPILPF